MTSERAGSVQTGDERMESVTDTPEGFRLDASTVEEVFRSCSMPSPVEPDVDPTYIDGDRVGPIDMIVTQAFLNKKPLQDHAEQIVAMLMELPTEFRQSGGGGWSFLNACNDRHGNQWTGLHLTMAKLVALGIGIGMVEYQLPRDLWDALPGGMPYFIVKDITPLDPQRLRIPKAKP